MPTFYFAIVNHAVLEDLEGTDLPDLEAARRHAHAVALEVMHHRETMLGHRWDEWKMVVKNDKGNEVLSFPVAEAANRP